MSDEQTPPVEPTPAQPIPTPAPVPIVSKTTGDKKEYVVAVKETQGTRQARSEVKGRTVVTESLVPLSKQTANVLATDPEDAWSTFCKLNDVTGAGLKRTITLVK